MGPRVPRGDRGDLAVAAQEGTDLERARANVRALNALTAADARGEATEEEVAAMAAYSGWGGAADAFLTGDRAPSPAWAEVAAGLEAVLTEDEYASARASTLTAFYTPGPVVRAIWDALEGAGLRSGDNVLEPGCGTGNFMRELPATLNLNFTGVEADDVSARIASHLLPGANIVSGALEDCYVSPGSFEAVVGNVPYSDAIKIHDPDLGRDVAIHDYFVSSAVDAVRPGGVVAVLTSRYTLDKRDSSMRRSLAERAELLAVARLPGETFTRQAGTEVVTDVLVLRRRGQRVTFEPGTEPEWVQTGLITSASASVVVNGVMAQHPELALGGRGMEITSGPFGPTLGLRSAEGVSLGDVADALRDTLARQLGSRDIDIHDGMGRAQEEPRAALRPRVRAQFEMFADEDGNVWYGNGENVVAVSTRRAGDGQRLLALLALRDAARSTLELERDAEASDEEVAARIAAVDAAYENFVATYGRLCERANQTVVDFGVYKDYSFNMLWNLEVTERGQFAGKADMLSVRVQHPAKPMPERVDTPREALAVSLDRMGGVDEELVARLLGVTTDDLRDTLGDLVVADPDTGRLHLAEAYLSGDVRTKLAHVIRLLEAETAGKVERAEDDWRSVWGISRGDLEPSERTLEAVDQLKREGVWDTAVHPLTSTRAVEVAARVTGLTRSWHNPIESNAAAVLAIATDELEPQGGITVEAHGGRMISNGLYSELIGNAMYSYYGDKGAANSKWLLLDRMAASTSITTEDLAKVLNDYGRREAIPDLCRDLGISPEEDEGQDWREQRWNKALEVATAMRERPVAEHLLALEKDDGAGNVPEDLDEWERQREDFVRRHANVDEARVAELRALRARLEDAMPADLGPGEVKATLGSSWLPPRFVAEFMSEKFGAGDHQGASGARKLEVARDPESGAWRVRSTMRGISPKAAQEFGTPECSPFHIVESALNGSILNVTKPDPTDPSGKKRVKDPQATMAAWQARHRVEAAFEEWVWDDPVRAGLLCAVYNARFNGLAPRAYDGSYLSLPDLNSSISLDRHQLDAVARILQGDEGTLIAHVVGAGKTFTGIVACHEAKRLGNATKPMIVVPNHITQQWAADFQLLYPTSKVIYMTDADTRSADAVRGFWARAAAGDWDAVIVGQSRFSQLNLSVETRERYYERRIAEMEASILEAKGDGKDFTVKQSEKAKKMLKGRLDSLRKDNALEGTTFEDLGCDMLVVDEAHAFKNLAVAGLNVAGMTVSASAKCEDLLDKCQWLREQGKGRNIVFETGTPVSNTMAELYNMQRYLAPGLLRSQGVSSFSAWANTFGQLNESVEVRPEGTGFQVKIRFSKFHNLPELMASFHCYADIRTNDMLNLDLPECEVVTEAVPATPEQMECVRQLAERAELVRNGSVDPSQDNMLAITGDGRKIALDPKLLDPDDPSLEPLEGGKVATCAENVARIWREEAGRRGTQLVFCDTSTPASGRWNVYADLKRRLVELGVPEAEIKFVSDAGDNPKKRDELFSRVNSGEVRVLMGSTQKLGTGTNCQARLAAIHDLDCPWRPSDLEQRLGRIVRRGNSYDEVRAFRYLATGTFDAYSYQIVERKQRFIAQVFTSKSPARSMDDLDESVLTYAEMKALATGDPNVARRMELENEISQLMLLEQAHATQAERMAREVKARYRPRVEILRARTGQLERDREAFAAAMGPEWGEEPLAEVPGRPAADRAASVRALREASRDVRMGDARKIGNYRGLEVWARRSQAPADSKGLETIAYVGLASPGTDDPHWCKNPFPPSDVGSGTVLRQMDRLAEDEAKGPELVADKLAEAERDLADATQVAGGRWEGADDLARKREELRLLDMAQGTTVDPGAVVEVEAVQDTPATAPTPTTATDPDQGPAWPDQDDDPTHHGPRH